MCDYELTVADPSMQSRALNSVGDMNHENTIREIVKSTERSSRQLTNVSKGIAL